MRQTQKIVVYPTVLALFLLGTLVGGCATPGSGPIPSIPGKMRMLAPEKSTVTLPCKAAKPIHFFFSNREPTEQESWKRHQRYSYLTFFNFDQSFLSVDVNFFDLGYNESFKDYHLERPLQFVSEIFEGEIKANKALKRDKEITTKVEFGFVNALEYSKDAKVDTITLTVVLEACPKP